MSLFFDNDIVYKLARCNLIDETLALLSSNTDNVSVLETLRYRFKLHKGGEEAVEICGNIETVERMSAFYDSCQKVPMPQSVETLAQLIDIPNIDEGEAILIASAIEQGDVFLFSGDKRAVRGLTTNKDISEKLHQRLVCLEHIFIDHIHTLGFEYVDSRMNPARECDTVLKIAFSGGKVDSALDALNYYLEEIRNASGGLLYDGELRNLTQR